MAALDFNMALARGLLGPDAAMQNEVKKLSGSDFKSEAWWNEQLDRQINKGIKSTEKQVFSSPIPNTRSVERMVEVTKPLTVGQLKAIQEQFTKQSADIKNKSSQKPKRKRGEIGLLSKASPVEVKGLATALPDLGVNSILSDASALGVK